MPSFDTVSEVDLSELKNALLMARKELQTRFDFRNSPWEIEEQKEMLVLHAENDFKLKALSEIVLGKLAKRNISLKNIEAKKAEISSVGRARQELVIKQGLEGDVAKQVVAAVKATGLKVQTQIQEKKVRVTGKSRDDLQEVIQALRTADLPVALSFDNFRD